MIYSRWQLEQLEERLIKARSMVVYFSQPEKKVKFPEAVNNWEKYIIQLENEIKNGILQDDKSN